jgi:hypothetical protein
LFYIWLVLEPISLIWRNPIHQFTRKSTQYPNRQLPFPIGEFMKLQRLGGYAVFANLGILTIALLFGILVFAKHIGDTSDPVKVLSAYSAAPAIFITQCWLVILLRIPLLIYALALIERMEAKAPNLSRMLLISASTATVMLIAGEMVGMTGLAMLAPKQEALACRVTSVIAAGLEGMGNFAWGWACLIIGCAILKTRAFPLATGWLYVLGGILAIPVGSGFNVPISGLFMTISQVWIGIILIRQKQPQPAFKEMVASS